MSLHAKVITLCAATHKEFLDIDKRAVKDFQNRAFWNTSTAFTLRSDRKSKPTRR